MEVDKGMVGELEAMGFAKALATKALTSSGNSSIEDAINWIVDHENTITGDGETSMEPEDLENINIEASGPIHTSEQVKLKAQELRNQARKKKTEQAKKLEREREKERIRAGKDLLEAKKKVEESARTRFIAQKKAEKEEEKRARENVKKKLQQDKLERQGVLGLTLEAPVPVKHDTETPQITKPIDPCVMPVRHASARDHMRECLRSLKLRHKDDNTKVMRAFKTLLIYVKNVVMNPDEAKFRKIRISNPVFQDRVGRFEEGIEFLELCGFERVEGGNFLLIPQEKVDMGILKYAAAIELHNALTNPYFGLFSG
ncbi:hypothetical protein ACS0TY_006573 [Phlomoides rotata]